MLQDGTIRLHFWIKDKSGTISEGVRAVHPGDAKYQDVLKHIGGLKQGEVKGIPPWPESGSSIN